MTEEIIDVEVVSTSLATYDKSAGMQLAEVKDLVPAMREQFERRDAFRSELYKELKEGDHFGFPPGCIPEFKTINGVEMVKAGYGKWESTKSYTPKKSLYQPGAAMVCQIFGWVVEFHADKDAWEMAGSKPGSFFFRCDLLKNGVKAGEGRGAAVIAKQADRDVNKTLKMAQKRAQVDATIRTAAIQDLFTQDIEDDNSNPSPKKDADSPNVNTRAERKPDDNTLSDLQKAIKTCFTAYKDKVAGASWADMAKEVTRWTNETEKELVDPKQWDEDLCQIVMIRIDEMEGE